VLFFDAWLDAACTARITADGQVRCIPGHDAYFYYFQDPQCSTALMSADTESCGVVTDNRFVPGGGVGLQCASGWAPTEVWERGAPFVGTIYQWNEYQSECSPAGESDGQFFVRGTVHPLEDFAVVSITE
jgi:hypothetical protein